MVNKKGLIRVVEAIVGILIILGVLILSTVKKETREEQSFEPEIIPLLEEVAKNSELRKNISLDYYLRDNLNEMQAASNEEIETNVENFVRSRLNDRNLDLAIEICKIDEVCYADDLPRNLKNDIFSYERIVSTDFEKEYFEPRRVKIFLWKKF